MRWALLLLLAGCSTTQLKETNTLYEGVHNLRLGVESLPGVVPIVDAYWPWMAGVRVGLNTAYAVKHTLLPENPLGLTPTVEVP